MAVSVSADTRLVGKRSPSYHCWRLYSRRRVCLTSRSASLASLMAWLLNSLDRRSSTFAGLKAAIVGEKRAAAAVESRCCLEQLA